jgi:precorrin-3B synthase
LRPEQEGQAAVLRQSAAADRCPGVLALHEAADGRLARIRLPGGRLSPLALDTVAGLAADFGNGILELTSRASLQVRGLAPGDAAAAAERLRGAGLLPSPAHDRVRNIIAGPLAGRGPSSLAATDELVAELDRRLCADPLLAELPGRFLFGVDDGAALIATERCDVALVAEGGGAFRLWLAGRPTTLAGDAPGHAAALALASGRVFRELRGDAWRIADLRDGPARIADCLGGTLLASAPAHAPRGLALGALAQRDGLVAVTALSLSPARTVTILDVPAARAPRLLAELAALDLVVGEGSGWRGLTACAGLGACASAQFDVRAVATARARERAPGSPAEHWAACERGCGCPAGALLGSPP